MDIPITSPTVGFRVWSLFGYRDHGPLNGPKIDISKNIGGVILKTDPRYEMGSFSSDLELYVVKWDNGQESKHYWDELFSIGEFQSLDDFEKAFCNARGAELTLGPHRGFRGFKASITYQGKRVRVELINSQRELWGNYLQNIAKNAGVKVRENVLPIKKHKNSG